MIVWSTQQMHVKINIYCFHVSSLYKTICGIKFWLPNFQTRRRKLYMTVITLLCLLISYLFHRTSLILWRLCYHEFFSALKEFTEAVQGSLFLNCKLVKITGNICSSYMVTFWCVFQLPYRREHTPPRVRAWNWALIQGGRLPHFNAGVTFANTCEIDERIQK